MIRKANHQLNSTYHNFLNQNNLGGDYPQQEVFRNDFRADYTQQEEEREYQRKVEEYNEVRREEERDWQVQKVKEEEREKVKSQLAISESQVEEYREENRSLMKQVESLQNKLVTYQNEKQRKIEEQEESIQEKEKEVEEMRVFLREESEKKETEKRVRSVVEQSNRESEERVQQLIEQLGRQKKESKKWEDALDEERSKLHQVRGDSTAFQAKEKGYRVQLEVLNQQINQMKQANQAQEKQIQKLEDSNRSVTQQNRVLSQETNQTTSQKYRQRHSEKSSIFSEEQPPVPQTPLLDRRQQASRYSSVVQELEDQLLAKNAHKQQVEHQIWRIEEERVRSGVVMRRKGELEKDLEETRGKLQQLKSQLKDLNALEK